jgi:arylsulfatase A-like enzyme
MITSISPESIIPSVFLTVGCISCNTTFITNTTKPNIILIMADDLGYNDLGCYGNDSINTPNIDYLAKNGLRFTDYHSNGPVSSPTRAALMTGKYQQRCGIEGVITARKHRHSGLSANEFTIADFFKQNNYQTGLIGKWHLGYDTIFSPLNNGFDFFKGYVSGNIDYHSHIDQTGIYDWWLNKDTLIENGYSTDLITYNAIEFISRCKKPFFLYIAHEAPHYPYQGRNDKADRTIGGYFNNLGSRKDRKAAYKEMTEAMDEGIGKLIKYLEKKKLLANTFIFFCSDNGAAQPGSNKPLHGYKGSVWEGSHRVPAIAYWKNKINPSVTDETVISMDLFPGFVDLVNPDENNHLHFDGTSFIPLLKGHKIADRPLFWRYKEKKAVRSGNWKYIEINNNKYLFNLATDLSEENNLIDSEVLPIL